jgi:uncharacterized protein
VAGAFLLVAAALPGLATLKIRTDGHALVPTYAPQVLLDAEIRNRFGLHDPVVVLIRSRHPDGIFNFATLRTVVRLTDALLEMEAVPPWTVLSLATEHNYRVFTGTLRYRRFLEPFPESQEELRQLRADLDDIRLFTGIVVSYDQSATAVMVGVPPRMDRADFYGQVRALVDSLDMSNGSETGNPDEIHVIGAPVAEALLGTHILEDLGVPRFATGHSTYTEADAASGVPQSLYELRVWIARNIGLLPLAVAMMALVFLVWFRSVIAMLLPLMEVGAALAFVFGAMGWCGVPVYLTIAVLPLILVVVGVTDEIHVFTRYRELLRGTTADDVPTQSSDNRTHVDVLHSTMDEMHRPVIKSSLTTAIALMSFALSPLAAVRAFGIFTGVGVIFCMFWSLMVIPALLTMIDPQRIVGSTKDQTRADRRHRTLERLAQSIIRFRVAVLLLALAVIAATPSGVRRLVVQDSWIDGFAPESEFRRATASFNEQFLGTHMLHVLVSASLEPSLHGVMEVRQMEARRLRFSGDLINDPKQLIGRWIKMRRLDEPEKSVSEQTFPFRWEGVIEHAERLGDNIVVRFGKASGSPQAALRLYSDHSARFEIYSRPFISPDLLRSMAAFETFLRARHDDAVGGVLGPATYMETTSFMAAPQDPNNRSIPQSADRVKFLWSQYERIRGVERRRQIVSDDFAESIVTVYMTDANFMGTARLMQAIRDYEREHLAPHGLSVSFAGDVAVSQTLIDAIVTTQVRSLLGSVAGILLITALLGRSLLWGVLSALPCGLAVLINFAVMGYVSMPLGVATSMFTGMTLGMGIDYAIHLLERYRMIRARGEEVMHSIVAAVSITGPAVFVDAIAVALGFGMMTLSQVPANARLGGLVVLSLGSCLVATFMLLPVLLYILRPRIIRRD